MFFKHFLIQRLSDSHNNTFFFSPCQTVWLQLLQAIYWSALYPPPLLLWQGWEKCVCLDMNQFYFGLLTEDERERVEKLEPFDEFEVRHSVLKFFWINTQTKISSILAIQCVQIPFPDTSLLFFIYLFSLGMASKVFPLLHPHRLQRLSDQSRSPYTPQRYDLIITNLQTTE